MAILWKRTNEKGVFWGLIAGLVTGFIRMILDFIYMEPACGQEDLRPWFVKDVIKFNVLLALVCFKHLKLSFKQVHYLNFAILLFFITVILTIIVTLCTERIENYRVGFIVIVNALIATSF